ncbi:unnamed protein product [Pleuronectes platessa]|uniref:Uncharacterized protein n=1 Tax=Pleuronectes platessa TaxID=8262 RepID=A0A9N7TR69_PLEPL|nr:unnamed protein product [Pleuronectes platessa]
MLRRGEKERRSGGGEKKKEKRDDFCQCVKGKLWVKSVDNSPDFHLQVSSSVLTALDKGGESFVKQAAEAALYNLQEKGMIMVPPGRHFSASRSVSVFSPSGCSTLPEANLVLISQKVKCNQTSAGKESGHRLPSWLDPEDAEAGLRLGFTETLQSDITRLAREYLPSADLRALINTVQPSPPPTPPHPLRIGMFDSDPEGLFKEGVGSGRGECFDGGTSPHFFSAAASEAQVHCIYVVSAGLMGSDCATEPSGSKPVGERRPARLVSFKWLMPAVGEHPWGDKRASLTFDLSADEPTTSSPSTERSGVPCNNKLTFKDLLVCASKIKVSNLLRFHRPGGPAEVTRPVWLPADERSGSGRKVSRTPGDSLTAALPKTTEVIGR